jgi:hypothetical protein
VRYKDAHRTPASSKSEYATVEDFGKLFTEDLNSLYLLSFLLTGSHEKAEKCVVAGLDECVGGNFVVREWAHSWARRTLIRNAIQMIAPHASRTRPIPDTFNLTAMANPSGLPSGDVPFDRVLALEDFDRFVFVLSVLERYIDQNCAVLLGTSRQKVQESRIRVLMRIADTDGFEGNASNTVSLCGAFD